MKLPALFLHRDIHGSLVLLAFWSRSTRLQSVPDITEGSFAWRKGDSIGSHRHRSASGSSTSSFWSPIFFVLQASTSVFSSFLILSPSFVVPSSSSPLRRQFFFVHERSSAQPLPPSRRSLFSPVLSSLRRRSKLKKTNSIRLASFPLTRFLSPRR